MQKILLFVILFVCSFLLIGCKKNELSIDEQIMSNPEKYSSLNYEEFISYIPQFIINNKEDLNLPFEKSCLWGSGIFFEWYIIEKTFLFSVQEIWDENSECNKLEFYLSYYVNGTFLEGTHDVTNFVPLLNKYLNIK